MKNKKMVLWILLPLTFFGFFTSAIIYKSLNHYKPSIYNYQSYINPDLIPELEKNYSYKEYKNNSEFVNAINNNKAVAGISTDYMIVDLINNHKVSKINFKDGFGIEKEDVKKFYTAQTNEQLDFFDEFLSPETDGDVDGDGKKDHFWEYIIPIWLNNKVFLYNSEKIKIGQNSIPPDIFKENSYTDILKGLKNNNVNVLSWTNAPIENSVIGSEISVEGFNTNLTLKNYESRINEFSEIIKNGTGYEINNSKQNIFEDDSDVILQSIIDPKSSVNGAYLFNGDGLDAYWSSDNFSNVENGTIKLIKPKNSPSFIDGFVVSSSISENKQIELLKNINDVFFKGKFMTEEEITQNIVIGDNIDWTKLPSLNNFDYVNYTPTSKGEYNFVLNNYFRDDEIAKSFYTIDKIIPVAPINQELQSKTVAYFKKKLRV